MNEETKDRKIGWKINFIKSSLGSGLTLTDIGIRLGVSRQAVSQFCKYQGISVSCSISIRKSKRLEDLDALKDANKAIRFKRKFGVERELVISVDDIARKAYLIQRHNAGGRKIPWNLNLLTWWKLWEESGKWGERGLGSGRYVMARFGDIGPYSIENIEIITHNQNSADCRKNNKNGRKEIISCKDSLPME